MKDNQELLDKLQKSIDLLGIQIDLMQQLRQMVMLSNIMNMPIKEITGKVSTSIHTHSRPFYPKPWLKDELVIKLDGEEVARKKLIDVPLDLWPEDIRAEYERQQKREMRKAHAQV